MTVEQGNAEANDQFPIGMRVLAVDDDPTCLLLLQTLLRRCQYHVTTTSHAITALKMLRENKNTFDLVISDVHMPDMDGFKLLELVGLEMDLPVIMLSANSDPKLVMKGITHGACDYLLKPIRIEELKNIWQHVIRRKKHDNKDRTDNKDKLLPGNGESAADQKLNKKRKDQNEDDDEDRDESGQDNEDGTSQKKPRVVWSVELHRKFVAAVHQLGIDKAVPKKILDLMNVDKLTRENVASHLQKYRLYLKRISTVVNQQANMVAALGSSDASYLQMSSMNGLALHNLAGPGQFQNAAFRSLPPGRMLGRLNSPGGLGMRVLPSPGMVQLGHGQTAGHLASSDSPFQTVGHSGSNGNIIHGMPMSLGLDQIQSNKGVGYIRELPTHIDDSNGFPVPSGFADSKILVGGSSSSFPSISNKPLMLEGHPQSGQDGQELGKQSSLTVGSLDSGLSSHFPDHSRFCDSWPSAVQSTVVQSNSFTLSESFKQATLHPGDIRDSLSTMALHNRSNSCDASSISSLPIHLQDSNAPQGWDDFRQDASYHSNAAYNSINSTIPINGSASAMSHGLNSSNSMFHRSTGFTSSGQSNFEPMLMKQHEVENSAMAEFLRSKEDYTSGQPKPHGSYVYNNLGSLEDLVNVMVKREQDGLKLPDGDFGCGPYSLRTCI